MGFCVMDPDSVREAGGDLVAEVVHEGGRRSPVSASGLGLDEFRRVLDESARFRVSSLDERVIAASGVVIESTPSLVVFASAGERLSVEVPADDDDHAVPGSVFQVLGVRRGDLIEYFRAVGTFRSPEPQASPDAWC